MSQFSLYLLGPPRLEVGREPIAVERRKAIALLAYLSMATPAQEHSRDGLATLLWADYDQSRARAALRNTLWSLNKISDGSWLALGREAVSLKPDADLWLDVAHFRARLAAVGKHGHPPNEVCPACLPLLTEAVALYRDDFLTGFTLSDSPDFDDWQLFQTESLRQELAEALERLVQGHSAQGEYQPAMIYARRWLALDPLHEPAHQRLMQLQYHAGNRAAALRQYRECVRILKQELGVSPSVETTALYERIRQGVEEPERRELEGTQENLNLSAKPIQPLAASGQPHLEEAVPSGPALTNIEDEIRPVTILCGDMSRSVEANWDHQPEETAALIGRWLAEMEKILLKYQARVDFLPGSGLLAIFGLPQLHEDDPERAVRAALEIQAAAQALGVAASIGINTGLVYFGRMEAAAPREITVLGPVVNLAVRLQSQAGTGHILVGAATYRYTHRAFRFTPLLLNLKDTPEPVPAYHVGRLRRRPEKPYGIESLRAQLIGRDEELAKLKAALVQVLAGHGQMVSLIGEAGVGKTRLVAELKQAAQRELGLAIGESRLVDHNPQYPMGTLSPSSKLQSPLLWLEGRCLELGMTASYWPFIDMFRAYFTFQPEEDDQTRAERFVIALQAMVSQGYLSEEQFEEVGPLLGQLLSLRCGDEWDERLKHANPEQIRHRTLVGLHDFWVALAQSQPVVLVLEDLHWADSLSLDLISLLMEALAHAPLFLLCVYRPEQQHKCWHLATIASRKCPAHFNELHLRELTPRQSGQLIESLLVIEELPEAIRAMILEKAQGNPFFVEEVIRSLIDAGLIYQERNVWRARAEIETVAVPESVRNVILSRVDRLRASLKQVLQHAAVMGRLFRRRVLAEMTLGETDLDLALEMLEDHALIYQERAVPEVEYSFKHVLTQEAVYQTIRPRRRAELHRQVAEVLEGLYQDRLEAYYEQLAYHYDRSEAVEQAIDYLLKAGEKARRAYLNDEAIGYFQRALTRLDLLNSPPSKIENIKSPLEAWRLAALKGLGQTYYVTGQTGEAKTYLRQAIVAGQEMGLIPRELVRLYFWLGEVLWWQSQVDEFIALAEEGLALLGNDTQSVEASLMNSHLGIAHWFRGDTERFREYGFRTAQFLEQLPYSEELRTAYSRVSDTHINAKQVEGALTWLQRFEQKATQHHHLAALVDVHWLMGYLLKCRGELYQAISRFQRGLELSDKIGDVTHTIICLEFLGYAFELLGHLREAEKCAGRELEMAELVEDKTHVGGAYWLFGKIFLSQGARAKAIDSFKKAAQTFQESGFPLFEVEALVSLGRTYLTQRQHQAALPQFQAAISRVKPDSSPMFEWLRPPFISALSGLEAAYEDPAAFRAFCQRFRQEHPETSASPFVQWYLEPAQPDFGFSMDDFDLAREGSQNLKWHDPFGDCSFTARDGLEIRAATGRDLWHINLSAPRLLRPMQGDFAVQIVCTAVSNEASPEPWREPRQPLEGTPGKSIAPAVSLSSPEFPSSSQKPAIGGILLWQDKENYLRLDRGVLGAREILFSGCLANQDVVIGRGRLSFTSQISAGPIAIQDQPFEPVFLRLERLSRHVKALCSTDGHVWFTVGQVEFPLKDPVEVGLHAIGNTDRTIYHGAFPEGTAMLFAAFQVWKRSPLSDH